MERARVVGLLYLDGRHGRLRGVGEQARRPRRVPHTRSTGADVGAALSASKLGCSAGPHVN